MEVKTTKKEEIEYLSSLLKDKKLLNNTLLRSVKNQNIENIMQEDPKSFRWLKTKREQDAFQNGYHYAQRDFIIILKKIVEV